MIEQAGNSPSGEIQLGGINNAELGDILGELRQMPLDSIGLGNRSNDYGADREVTSLNFTADGHSSISIPELDHFSNSQNDLPNISRAEPSVSGGYNPPLNYQSQSVQQNQRVNTISPHPSAMSISPSVLLPKRSPDIMTTTVDSTTNTSKYPMPTAVRSPSPYSQPMQFQQNSHTERTISNSVQTIPPAYGMESQVVFRPAAPEYHDPTSSHLPFTNNNPSYAHPTFQPAIKCAYDRMRLAAIDRKPLIEVNTASDLVIPELGNGDGFVEGTGIGTGTGGEKRRGRKENWYDHFTGEGMEEVELMEWEEEEWTMEEEEENEENEEIKKSESPRVG